MGLMRAYPTELLTPLAVHAQDLEARGETVVPQPAVDVSSSDLASVFCPIVVNVVDGEECLFGFPTASTDEAPIGLENRFLDAGIHPPHPTVVVFSAGGAMVLGHQRRVATPDTLTGLVPDSLLFSLTVGCFQGALLTGLHPFTRDTAAEDAQPGCFVSFLRGSGHLELLGRMHDTQNSTFPGEHP